MAHLVGQGPTALPGPTSEIWTTPYPLTLGSRARDAAGNEYIFVDFTSTVFGGSPVQISGDFTATILATTGRGPVGVACGAATSDNAGWVQIFGRAVVHLGMSGVSPSDAANGPTTVNTSVATRFRLGTSLTSPNGIGWSSDASTGGYVIEGISVASDTSVGDVSAVTSATSHPGNQIAVFLNYPTIRYEEHTT